MAGKGDKNNRIKDWNAYWRNFNNVFKKNLSTDKKGSDQPLNKHKQNKRKKIK